jgi:hypothetical protein
MPENEIKKTYSARAGCSVPEFVKRFVRDAFGTWRCIEPAEVELPGGRVQVARGAVFTPGTKFMNADIAQLLNRYSEEQRDPP